MKRILFLLIIFCALRANGQNITFIGSGLSSVKIENLTKAASVTVNAEEVLTLSAATGISQIDNKKTTGINIYPNPMTDRSTFEVLPPAEGDAIITVYEMTGKPVTQINTYLENSLQKFNISGLNKGLYLINIKANTYQFSGKLICNGKSNGTTIIEKVSNDIQAVDEKTSKMDYKGLQDNPYIQYSPGDVLKFTGISGTNTTIVTAKTVIQDTTITFVFVACTDGDGNNYPVVDIGGQVWMAENLKTTKYKDLTDISNVTDNVAWAGLNTPAFCWYNNDTGNKNVYGALYNWHTVGTGKLCPTDWHVPTDAEWTALIDYLGGYGNAATGGKLKETGLLHWNSPNTGATNESGFTALGHGSRSNSGVFGYIGMYNTFWTSTKNPSITSYYAWGMGFNYSNLDKGGGYSVNGYAVRCVNGIDPSLISTETKINDTLLLCYSKLHEYIEFSYLFDAVYANKVTAPNISWNDIYNHSQSPTNQKVLMLWLNAYEIIYKANLVILSATQVISDPLTRDQIIAQAKGIRAYLNYNLLIWFGEIPLEEGSSEGMIPRNTIDEVMVWIKNDALEAAQSLPMSWSASEKFRIPQSFANGLLARVSLYNKSWTEALTPTQQIISSGMYALSADTNNFSSTNSEIFWGFEKSANAEFNLFFNKGSYVPVIRYTESYLVSAEALYNSGNPTGAVSYINTLIIRRGGTAITAADLTKDVIYKHWRTEMAKEGNMFITLKRFDNALGIVQGMSHKLMLPVPQTIIESNPNMTQNPGY